MCGLCEVRSAFGCARVSPGVWGVFACGGWWLGVIVCAVVDDVSGCMCVSVLSVLVGD